VPADIPLYRVWRYGYVDMPPGATTALLSVPTLRDPLHDRAKALTLALRARRLTTTGLRAVAVVRPAGEPAAGS
jgi:hypothetical protein